MPQWEKKKKNCIKEVCVWWGLFSTLHTSQRMLAALFLHCSIAAYDSTHLTVLLGALLCWKHSFNIVLLRLANWKHHTMHIPPMHLWFALPTPPPSFINGTWLLDPPFWMTSLQIYPHFINCLQFDTKLIKIMYQVHVCFFFFFNITIYILGRDNGSNVGEGWSSSQLAGGYG